MVSKAGTPRILRAWDNLQTSVSKESKGRHRRDSLIARVLEVSIANGAVAKVSIEHLPGVLGLVGEAPEPVLHHGPVWAAHLYVDLVQIKLELFSEA